MVENYRPLSLLEVPAKIFERIIVTELNQHLDDNNVLHHRQHGFRKGRGTDTAIALVYEAIAKAHSNKQCVSLVNRDVKGAFDKVWHSSHYFFILEESGSGNYVVKSLTSKTAANSETWDHFNNCVGCNLE